MMRCQQSPIEPDKTHTPWRNHVEQLKPFPTLSRRASFYIDHEWYLEGGEELPVHKDNPKQGGDHPLRMLPGDGEVALAHAPEKLGSLQLDAVWLTAFLHTA